MRLRVRLKCKQGSLIPINYQYELSAWIYKVLAKANPEFAAWLHDQGYGKDGRKYKLFTYGRLQILPPFQLDKEKQGILIQSGIVRLDISFWVTKAVEHFLLGLFQDSHLGLGNKSIPAVDFEIQSVEMLPPPEFSEQMKFSALSPICITQTKENERYAHYCHPEEEDYEKLFFEHLVRKYAAAINQDKEALTDFNIDNMKLQILSKPKSKLVHIKAGTPQESKIRGYLYKFEITAPKALTEFAYQAGFGEKNSVGFGMVSI